MNVRRSLRCACCVVSLPFCWCARLSYVRGEPKRCHASLAPQCAMSSCDEADVILKMGTQNIKKLRCLQKVFPKMGTRAYKEHSEAKMPRPELKSLSPRRFSRLRCGFSPRPREIAHEVLVLVARRFPKPKPSCCPALRL